MTIEQIDRRIRQALAALRLGVEVVRSIKAAAGGTAEGKGLGDHDLELELARHYGFASRPPDDAVGVALKPDGKGDSAVLVSYRKVSEEPSLEKGESAQFSTGGAKVHCDKDGNVIFNSGNRKVAYYDGQVRIGTLSGTVPVGGGAVTFTFVPANADGTPNVSATQVTTSVNLFGRIGDGASNVKT